MEDGDMTGQQHAAGHDHMVLNGAVMGDVRVGHEHAIVPDTRNRTF